MLMKLWIYANHYVNCRVKNCLKEDHHSYIRTLCSCKKKAWKIIQACTGFKPLTSVISVQRSTNFFRLFFLFQDYMLPEFFFQAFFSQLLKLCNITAMIFLQIILHSAVHIIIWFSYIHNFINSTHLWHNSFVTLLLYDSLEWGTWLIYAKFRSSW